MELNNEQTKEEILQNQILRLSFNRTNTCISAGTEIGFSVYRISPFEKIIDRGIQLYYLFRLNYKNFRS